MRNEPTPLSFDDFADELIEESQPRAWVILAASKIDNLLRDALESYFAPKVSKANEPDELLDGDTPLSAFSARIKACSRLSIIDPKLAKEFNLLRQIRNQAAHWVSFSVKESPLREQFLNLKETVSRRRSYSLTTNKFLPDHPKSDVDTLKAVLLTLCVLAASVAKHTARTKRKAKYKILD